ncbi:hypothetical protein [Flagellimonas nanhaiensis]|uniref:Uncharacterized protein n=1 Tax=Flagellimonas nanhaiensis TaxID=2292706 RepID=A0A371JL70_9FLAO|nr:hypothetical protein [Allomuricauda nanhaiensis]RDY57714.1 hypothetical protein DX873_17600 [Allomuricauda nanhaiensis]
MTKDLQLTEYGSGGDITLMADDLLLNEELLQMAYLAMFGGNKEASTKGNELEDEERVDWWGNTLLFGEKTNKQMNSTTERILDDVVLNSSGRLEIKRAVEKDLEFLAPIAEVTVAVSIETSNRVEIFIKLERLSNQQEKILQLIFDNATKAIIIDQEI